MGDRAGGQIQGWAREPYSSGFPVPSSGPHQTEPLSASNVPPYPSHPNFTNVEAPLTAYFFLKAFLAQPPSSLRPQERSHHAGLGISWPG